MSIKLTPVYKSVTLTVQGKCTKCTRGIKGCLCGGFQLILNNYFFSCHLRIVHSHGTHSSITHSSHALYLTHTWQFEYLPH